MYDRHARAPADGGIPADDDSRACNRAADGYATPNNANRTAYRHPTDYHGNVRTERDADSTPIRDDRAERHGYPDRDTHAD